MLACPSCLAPPADRVWAAREMMVGLRESFDYSECSSCGTLWLPHPPSDLARFYGEGYYSMEARGTGHRSAALSVAASAILLLPERLRRVVASERVLDRGWLGWFAAGISKSSAIADVGSGEGDLLRQFAHCGFSELWGFDPFVNGDRDEGVIRIRKSEIAGAPRRFDFVMFNHSLEHVSDPAATLTDAAAVLEPGGSILVRLPVAQSAWREYGVDWVGLDAPRHLYVPTVEGFRRLVGRIGLTIERTFFDALPLDFWGSERYRNDIALLTSDGELPPGYREGEAAAMPSWTTAIRERNRAGTSDSAGFILRPRS